MSEATEGRLGAAAASCCDDYDPQALAGDEALQRILAAITPLRGIERVAVRAALGRVLAAPVCSTIAVPAHRNSAMDGYALRAADAAGALQLIGESFAGRPFDGSVAAGQCVRIMTGAVIPADTDAVVPQEMVERSGETIRVRGTIAPGDNVREAGEDIALGETVLEPGRRLVPADLGMLASLGLAEVPVHRCLRVAFFSTGDELRSIGEALGPGDVYDSNRYTLYGMLDALGVDTVDMGVVRDQPDALRTAFEEAGACADAVITSGGVSVGEADYVKEILQQVGRIQFWKVAMKPGRPLAFGRVGGAVFFGLPGNPVSVMVTFYQFVQPALRHLAGERVQPALLVRAVTRSRLRKRPGRVEYQRGVLARAPDGTLTVERTGEQGSGILRSMSDANCFIVLPVEGGTVEAGSEVDVQPFHGLL